LCKDLAFEFLGNTSEHNYFISELELETALDGEKFPKLLTWLGSMNCLKENDLQAASFDNEEDKAFFQNLLATGIHQFQIVPL